MLESDEYKIVCNPEFLYLPISFQASGVFSTIDIDFNLINSFLLNREEKTSKKAASTQLQFYGFKKSIHTTHVFVNIIIINIVTFSLFS